MPDEPTTNTTLDQTVAEESEATEEEASSVEDVADGAGESAGSVGETDDSSGSEGKDEDAIDLDELATLVADKIKGDGGSKEEDDELMAKVRRVIKEEKESDRAEDRLADKVAAKVGGRSPDPPPAPEYRRLAKLLFGKRG